MKWDIEKAESVASPVLDAVAVASVLVVLVGAALAAAGSPWSERAYFSVAALLFDIGFTFEFFARLRARRGLDSVLSGLSSALPLLLVSGPFLYGWASADFSSAAVRGYALSSMPLGGLSVVAAVRLVRVTRLGSLYGRDAAAPKPAGRAPRIAAAVGLSVVLAGAMAADALWLPGYVRAARRGRENAVEVIAAARGDESARQAALAAGVVALALDGRTVMAADPGRPAGDSAFVSRPPVEAWFDARDDVRARGLSETVAALASLLAAIAYVAAGRPGPGARQGRADGDGDPEPRARLSDEPAGDEELAGILGKRSL